ncbi:Amino acid permease [Zea mays]|uniref:Amino acid permease n=1 Tax=Zea mays TaxID=4577 RepID=A0A1D6J730_MAIZE|nr:Amino acid permease [Zea mays]
MAGGGEREGAQAMDSGEKRHRAAVRHLGLLLLRRAVHHDERGAGGVRAVAGPGRPAVVGVAPYPPAAQGAGERGVAVRGGVHAAGPAHPAHQRGVHGHHLHRHHRLGGRLRGAHLRAHGDAGGRLPAGPLLPRPRQQARLPRRLPLDLLHLLRLPAPHRLPHQDGHLQLRAHRARRLPRPHHALVAARRAQVVQRPRQEHRRPQQRQGLNTYARQAKASID